VQCSLQKQEMRFHSSLKELYDIGYLMMGCLNSHRSCSQMFMCSEQKKKLNVKNKGEMEVSDRNKIYILISLTIGLHDLE
jgi:hypothetical protein